MACIGDLYAFCPSAFEMIYSSLNNEDETTYLLKPLLKNSMFAKLKSVLSENYIQIYAKII